LWLADDAERFYDGIAPVLARVRKAADEARAAGKPAYTGNAPMLYYYLADVECKVKRYDRANGFISSGMGLCAAQPGNDGTWARARLEQVMGRVCLEEKKYEEAKSHLLDAMHVFIAIGGKRHLQVAESHYLMARALFAEGHYKEAQQNIEAACLILRGNPGEQWRIETYYDHLKEDIEEHM